ncbi:MAG: RdgB/HAM1 family non-canonical purine NTP pyrophosphatase [Oceanococcus sp.]
MNAHWLKPGSQWVLASGNKGKLAELRHALSDLSLALLPISQWTEISPEETGSSFESNAIIKARHAAELTGLPSLADDSGLAVDALGGAPGVYSARYAGQPSNDANNNAKLLHALENVADEQRTARFVCVIALLRSADDPAPLLARGEWHGRIARVASGNNGFGYDPLFMDEATQSSAASLSPEQKIVRSHRGKAISLLKAQLAELN